MTRNDPVVEKLLEDKTWSPPPGYTREQWAIIAARSFKRGD